jgi:hypothetical protein
MPSIAMPRRVARRCGSSVYVSKAPTPIVFRQKLLEQAAMIESVAA